jgi:hypothetical protein
MSEQPDELKLPGQVRDALNVLPDVTKGLLKRPGARLINPLATTKDGSWFHIYRDATDQYIGRISPDGNVRIWSCYDGLPRVVTYQDTPFQLYPKPPNQGSADNSNRPAYPGCNTTALTLAIDNLRTTRDKANAKRKEIDSVQTQIEAIEKSEGSPPTYLEYSPKRDNASKYTVTVGQVVHKDMIDRELTIDFNKPVASTTQVVERASKPAVRDQMIVVGSAPGGIDRMVHGSIYAWVLKNKNTGNQNNELQALKTRLTQLEGELEPLVDDEEAAKKEYERQAGPCGIFSTPYSLVTHAPLTDPQVQDYLKHDQSETLQFLTVNDYTFITNRSRTVTISGSATDTDPTHRAFVTLDQIAYNKVYALNFYSTNAPTPVKTSTATKLKVIDRTALDKAASCPDQDVQIFDKTVGTKTNLRFELKVIGQSVPKDESDPYKGYKCDYHTIQANLINGGEGWVKGDTVKVTMKGVTYTIQVEEASHYSILADIAKVRPPTTSSTTTDVLKAETILESIATEIEKTPFLFATVIGNGILIESLKPFNIDTPEKQLMSVMTDAVNNVSRLPQQCKDGYIVKVVNSAENEDDYYLKFVSRNPGVDGEGVWEETIKPGVLTTLNPESMPHQIVYNPNTNSFVVSPVDWEPRLVGDDTTNPQPSFVGKQINKMLFFRNRLVMLSDENVVMSRPGDYWNFWAKTAMTVTAADMIDISASSTYPAILYDGIEVNAGMLLFSANQQFLLTTDNDLLTPETVKINSIASYQFNYTTQPVSMGTTVGFLNNAGMNARLFEMTNILREGEVECLEQSKLISEKLPANMNQLADSRENNLLMCGTQGQRDVWGYRYFNTGEERIQSAWFRWELTGDLVYHCIMKDVYYAVLSNTSDSSGNIIVSLQRFDLKNTDWTAIVEDSENYPYTVHMDNYRVVLPNELQWYPHLNQTYFRLPMGYFSDKRFAAYTLKRGKFQGRAAYPKIEIDSLGTWAVFEGNWSDTRLMIGYEFEMNVELPTIYYQKQESSKTRSDLRSSLVVHRVKLHFGPVGVYETTIKRKGRPDYTSLYESREQDGYDADAVAFVPEKSQTVPCYERNTNLTIHVRSNHPSPATVYSMTWEGDYNKMYYERV